MSIEVKVKKKDEELFKEVARSVRAAVSKYGEDVEVRERKPIKLSSEEKEVLLALKSLEGRGIRPDVFGILSNVTAEPNRIAVAVQECKKKGLIKEESGVFQLTEAGESELRSLK
jgi:predicted transcriptional regulator